MSWIQTYTGRKFYPLNPRKEDVCIEDIAHALSLTCRFSGHVKSFYSVAEHSCHACDVIRGAMRGGFGEWFIANESICALLHDSAEAYIPDFAAPIKGSMYVAIDGKIVNVKSLEHDIICAISSAFSVWELKNENRAIKDVDLSLLIAERDALMRRPPEQWCIDVPPANIDIMCWSPDEAEKQFLNRFNELIAILREEK